MCLRPPQDEADKWPSACPLDSFPARYAVGEGHDRSQDRQDRRGRQLAAPQTLKDARIAFDEGRIDGAAFRAAEDASVTAAVRLQESAGLDIISDGEMRRLNFQDSSARRSRATTPSARRSRVYERRVEGSAPLQRAR